VIESEMSNNKERREENSSNKVSAFYFLLLATRHNVAVHQYIMIWHPGIEPRL